MAACINCNNEVLTRYCGNCAQPNPPKKLSFGNMWYDFQSRIYGFDGMFPRTLRDLTIRPGVAAREHIKGNRVKYYGPVGYFFLMVTVFLLILSIMGLDFLEFTKTSTTGIVSAPQDDVSLEFQRRMMALMTDNMKVFSFLIVVPMIFMARLFFRKAGYNLLEHSVIPFYVFGHTYWLTTLGIFTMPLIGAATQLTAQFIVMVLFFAFACSDFYTHNSKVKAFFKGLAVYLSGYLLFILIVIVLSYLYIFTDPEFQELIKASKK